MRLRLSEKKRAEGSRLCLLLIYMQPGAALPPREAPEAAS